MKQDAIVEVQKIWSRFSEEKSWTDFAVDHDLYKKMLLAFQPGPCYYWLLNTNNAAFEMMSSDVEKVLGYTANEASFPFLMKTIHPDDMPFLLNFESKLAEFFSSMPSEKRFNYKIQYDFRMRAAKGNYVRILNQMAMVQFEANSNLIRTFGVHTDITHLKKDLKPVLSFIAFNDDDPSYYDVNVAAVFKPAKNIFTTREKQVLNLMMEGMMSKEICLSLNISKHTVDTHRKHLMEKTAAKSIPEMIKKSIINGWI